MKKYLLILSCILLASCSENTMNTDCNNKILNRRVISCFMYQQNELIKQSHLKQDEIIKLEKEIIIKIEKLEDKMVGKVN